MSLHHPEMTPNWQMKFMNYGLRCLIIGYRRVTAELQRRGYPINHKRVLNLMRAMNLKALYPTPKTTIASPDHKVYPYLLRDIHIAAPNQVWSTDITYIKISSGFVYLVAIIDIYSRFVLSWQISNTLDKSFCLDMLEHSLTWGCPNILNTDQGCQFTRLDVALKTKRSKNQYGWSWSLPR